MIERKRPLPIGRYWVDVSARNRIAWDAWVKFNGEAQRAHGEVAQHFEAADGAESRDFYIFNTTEPTVWPDAELGFAPNVAGPEIKSYEDVIQKPPPAEPLDPFRGVGDAIGKGLGLLAGAVVVVALVAAALAMRKSRR